MTSQLNIASLFESELKNLSFKERKISFLNTLKGNTLAYKRYHQSPFCLNQKSLGCKKCD